MLFIYCSHVRTNCHWHMIGSIKHYYCSLPPGELCSLAWNLRGSLFHSPLILIRFASCPTPDSSCLAVSCTVLKETGPKKPSGARCKHSENCQMCFGGFLPRLPPAWPLSMPGCRGGFNPRTGDRFFLSVGTHIGHGDANSLPSEEAGRAKNHGCCFSFFKKWGGGMIIFLGTGEASLRCYAWDHLGDCPLLFWRRPGYRKTHARLVLNPLLHTRYYIYNRWKNAVTWKGLCESFTQKPEIMKEVILGVKTVKRPPHCKTCETKKGLLLLTVPLRLFL